MKFVLLKSHGGNYMVVVENIAWLRTDAEAGARAFALLPFLQERR